MNFEDAELRETLLGISKAIEQAVRKNDPTLFFAAFVELSTGVYYVSNGARPEIQRLLPKLVDCLEGSRPPRRPTTSTATDTRLAVERTCADVGKTFPRRCALFVFKNTEDCPDDMGVNAWFSSLPGAPEVIRQWLARAKA